MFTATETSRKIQISFIARLVLAAIAAGILFIGVLPSWLTEIIGAFASVN
jgi:hypothetical protein